MGGGSGDAAAALRLAAHAAGRRRSRAAAAARGGARRRRPLPGRARPHADDRRRRARRALGDPEPLGLLILPSAHALSTPAVYREFDRLGARARAAELDARSEAARAGELPPRPQRPRRTPPARCARRSTPRSPRSPAPAPATCWCPAPGPTVFGLFADPARRGRGAPPRGRSRRDRRRAGRRRRSGRSARGVKWGWLLTAVALRRLPARAPPQARPAATLAAGGVAVLAAVLIGIGVVELPNLEKLIEDVGTRARPVDLPARRRARVPRDRRVRRARRAGGDDGDRRRRRRRPGPDLAVRADRDRLGVRGGRRPHLVHARAAGSAALAAAPRRAR